MIAASPRTRAMRWRAVALEAAGVGAALAVALAVLAHLASSPRTFLLFTDGDSVQLALVHSSLRMGQPQDWAFSAVLFLPELAVYLPLAALLGDPRAALAVAGVVNWVACYAAYRFTAGSIRMSRPLRVLGAVLAITLLGGLALCESSADRNALEPASLLMTTTYYSSTVVATIVSVGLAARMLTGRVRGRGRWSSRAVAIALGAVTAVAVLGNPIVLAWSAVPLVAVGALTLAARVPARRVVLLAAVLATGAALGFLARIPFAPWIAESGAEKVRPDRAVASAGYYEELLHTRLVTAAGAVELVLVVLLLCAGGVLLQRALRRRGTAEAVVAGASVLTPMLVIAGALLLGTDATRYLQPVVFLAPLAVLPALAVRVHLPARLPAFPQWASLAGVVALGVAIAGIGTGAAVAAARSVARPDPSVACVVSWVDRSGQYGAGQFWTVRAPKAFVADPRRLIQTDAALNGYAWLVDRADFDRRRVTFLVSSADSPAYALPADPSAPGEVVACGRYTVTEYPDGLRVGTPHG